ncbi:MAG TPA: cytochrome P450 [Solirubrobacteraceae bacterium]|nr:cytochrome P450 [Solirubrobacteraceae bacterium]
MNAATAGAAAAPVKRASGTPREARPLREQAASATPLLGQAPPSPAGPAPDDGSPERLPPGITLPRALQTLRFSVRQIELVFRARRQLGEVFRFNGMVDDEVIVITSHPDHVRSLFTADPELAPSLTGESPLRPIVGPNSVLTLLGPEHMRQRKLLLPSFHGGAIERYTAMIAQAAEREIDRWPLHDPFALAPAMQAITLDVIMSGIFGVEGVPREGTPERALREEIKSAVRLATRQIAQMIELLNINRSEPIGPVRRLVAALDRPLYATIAARRAAGDAGERTDILSLLLAARDEDGKPMSDQELRDELLTLVLAGHETTANSLAWTFERLLRTPHAYERLREEVRSDDGQDAGADYVEATIHEAMRSRPVIPIIGRRVQCPWQLGEWRLPAGSSVLMSILLLHHRPDVYPDPFAFRPERFLGVKGGRASNTYTWIPFGGGIRRCLGATLAMAEQRVVVRAIARRTDMTAADPAPERARHRNVTMIPARGAQVILNTRTAA